MKTPPNNANALAVGFSQQNTEEKRKRYINDFILPAILKTTTQNDNQAILDRLTRIETTINAAINN